MSETSDLTGPILKALERMGWMAMRLNSGVAKRGRHFIKLCPAGTPDILAFREGEVLWVETKCMENIRGMKRSTATAQADFRDRVLAINHKHVRATCLDDVLTALRS